MAGKRKSWVVVRSKDGKWSIGDHPVGDPAYGDCDVYIVQSTDATHAIKSGQARRTSSLALRKSQAATRKTPPKVVTRALGEDAPTQDSQSSEPEDAKTRVATYPGKDSGKIHLEINGVTLATEGDICRDSLFRAMGYHLWTKDALECAANLIRHRG